MPIDPEQPALVLEALRSAETLDARAIEVIADDDTIVLRGSVATFEESAAAAGVAEAHVPAVRNELSVDVNLREGLDDEESPAPASDIPIPGQHNDLVEDLQEALEENVPWDPPTEDVHVPTRAEARGSARDRGVDDEETA